MKEHKKVLLNSAAPLLVSLIIYVLFRPGEIVVNKFLFSHLFNLHLSISYQYNWMIYSLPGALWLYSFIYYNTIYSSRMMNSLLPLSFALGIEMLQLFKITDGTFDLVDVGLYLFTWLAFVFVNKHFRSSEFTIIAKTKRPLRHKLALTFFMCVVFLSDVWHK